MMSSRSLFALLLAVMLSLTGQSMAVARGANAATGQMVICTGTGPQVVLIDARGQPVAPAHHCPECLVQDLSIVARLPGVHWQPAVRSVVTTLPALKVVCVATQRSQPARGPPVSV